MLKTIPHSTLSIEGDFLVISNGDVHDATLHLVELIKVGSGITPPHHFKAKGSKITHGFIEKKAVLKSRISSKCFESWLKTYCKLETT